MITEELSKEEWTNLCQLVKFETVFAQVDFLEVYCSIYNVKPLFFVVNDKNIPRVALTCFSKGKKIVYPTHFMFSALWIDEKQGEVLQNRAIQSLLTNLKMRFKNIALRLPVEVRDTRPFTWQGFKETHKYTYLKNLQNQDYHLNIKRILKNKTATYWFKVAEWTQEVEEFHLKDLLSLGFKRSYIYQILSSFKALHRKKKIIIFNGYLEEKLVGSDMVLIDEALGKAYMFLISKCQGQYKEGFPAFMYDFAFNYLKNMGMKEVDLFGANIEPIATYKSKFCPTLVDFFEVRYSRRLNAMETLKKRLKEIVKTLLYYYD